MTDLVSSSPPPWDNPVGATRAERPKELRTTQPRLRKMARRLVLFAILMAVACAAPSNTSATITGHLVAGPVCPVETDPPDPACVPRPVPNAEVIAVSFDGTEYRTTSDFDGVFRLTVPAGELNITFSEVEGMLTAPEAITVTMADRETIDLGEIFYDTGIR